MLLAVGFFYAHILIRLILWFSLILFLAHYYDDNYQGDYEDEGEYYDEEENSEDEDSEERGRLLDMLQNQSKRETVKEASKIKALPAVGEKKANIRIVKKDQKKGNPQDVIAKASAEENKHQQQPSKEEEEGADESATVEREPKPVENVQVQNKEQVASNINNLLDELDNLCKPKA